MGCEWYGNGAAGSSVTVIMVSQIMLHCSTPCFLSVVANNTLPVWRNTLECTSDLKLRLTSLHSAVNTSPSSLSYRSRPASLGMLVVVRPLTTQSGRLLPFLNWKLRSFIEMQAPHWNAGRLSCPAKMSVITLTLPSSLRRPGSPASISHLHTRWHSISPLHSTPLSCLSRVSYHLTVSLPIFYVSCNLFLLFVVRFMWPFYFCCIMNTHF